MDELSDQARCLAVVSVYHAYERWCLIDDEGFNACAPHVRRRSGRRVWALIGSGSSISGVIIIGKGETAGQARLGYPTLLQPFPSSRMMTGGTFNHGANAPH
jgi:hypothetical protein